MLEEDPVESALQTDQDEWDQETYLLVCEALMRSKIEHRMFLIATALDEVAPDLPQDVRLRIRNDVTALAGSGRRSWRPLARPSRPV
jgi:hypothetical protein